MLAEVWQIVPRIERKASHKIGRSFAKHLKAEPWKNRLPHWGQLQECQQRERMQRCDVPIGTNQRRTSLLHNPSSHAYSRNRETICHPLSFRCVSPFYPKHFGPCLGHLAELSHSFFFLIYISDFFNSSLLSTFFFPSALNSRSVSFLLLLQFRYILFSFFVYKNSYQDYTNYNYLHSLLA